MKICGIISEFNPFHNGHAYIISEARRLSGCDFAVCIMSGQFTQRGEVCKTDKYLRAKHALIAGADAVIELPAPFAVAPAEVFAKGAVKLLSQIDGDLTLCFGSENKGAESFIDAARTLSTENPAFKKLLAEKLAEGLSYIKSYASAFEALGGDPAVISTPNNILGVEYCKAVLSHTRHIKIITVPRALGCGYSSAHGIRERAANGVEFKAFMPDYAYSDFCASTDCEARFKQACADGIYFADKEKLKQVYGCGEGLENRLKKLTVDCGGNYDKIVENATSKRYSSARIRRIMTANLLGLYSDDAEKFLNAPLPLKVLAVKKECADRLLPLLTAQGEPNGEAVKCAEITSRAYALWRYLSTPTVFDNPNEKTIFI